MRFASPSSPCAVRRRQSPGRSDPARGSGSPAPARQTRRRRAPERELFSDAHTLIKSKCFSKTNRQFRSALLDDPVLPEVGVGEEGDVVLWMPVDGVDDEVKVARRLVEEVVERRDDLEPVLLRGGVPEGERAGEEAVLHVDHEEGGRRRRQDGLDPLPVLRLPEELASSCSDTDLGSRWLENGVK